MLPGLFHICAAHIATHYNAPTKNHTLCITYDFMHANGVCNSSINCPRTCDEKLHVRRCTLVSVVFASYVSASRQAQVSRTT
jgi:hypothetical protein